MRQALATLPWVEHGTIQTDTDVREVRFNLRESSAFDEEAVKVALKNKGFPELTVMKAPTK